MFTRNIRSARRGAVGGPSGMTAKHLRFILESPSETAAFFRAAQDLARAEIPQDVLLCMGLFTALRGGVRGIVCADERWWQGVLHNRSHQWNQRLRFCQHVDVFLSRNVVRHPAPLSHLFTRSCPLLVAFSAPLLFRAGSVGFSQQDSLGCCRLFVTMDTSSTSTRSSDIFFVENARRL